MYKIIIIVFFTILLAAQVSALNAQCVKENKAFNMNEKITFDVIYNWGFIWIEAGYVEFKVNKAYFNSKQVYHFDAWGTSLEKYDWIFKVRDRYQAYADMETLQPLWFERTNYEGGFEVHNIYNFNYQQGIIKASLENSDHPKLDTTIPLKDCTLDLISIIYHARNIDFSKYKADDRIPLRVIIDGEIFDLFIRYHGKETITTRDKVSYSCEKFSALLVEGTIFNAGEDLTVWVTDDKNRIPVMVEAKILVGSVKAMLKGAHNLRNPTVLKTRVY